ncbi:MAG: 3-deoxy-7-phosphoheptulonate synthase [Clostridiales bacterium]|nr:3-deoxy-7-phosphoheptulonate synthase [Clostridiales bacterium]
MKMKYVKEMPNPDSICTLLPLDEKMAADKAARDTVIENVFTGKDSRFLLIIGPCSADRKDAVLDYMQRLRTLQDKVQDKIFIIPRLYTNKPRTTGDGYKGMLHQPDPSRHEDMLKGLLSIRELHLSVIRETGFSCADEMLYPENYAYLQDVLAYVAIGARSVENQHHRLVSSGISVPVGMKNPTSGDLSVMMNSIMAAQHGHTFTYRGWEVQSEGNPLSHAILRGYVDDKARNHPNYHYEDLIHLVELYGEKKLQNPAVIIDTNHANSAKQYLEQSRIAKDVIHSFRHSKEIHSLVKGLMIESYLEDGRQEIGSNSVYGRSITDACLGWEKTERLVLDIAELV